MIDLRKNQGSLTFTRPYHGYVVIHVLNILHLAIFSTRTSQNNAHTEVCTTYLWYEFSFLPRTVQCWNGHKALFVNLYLYSNDINIFYVSSYFLPMCPDFMDTLLHVPSPWTPFLAIQTQWSPSYGYGVYGHPVEIASITNPKQFTKELCRVHEYAKFVCTHPNPACFSQPGVLSFIPQDENM